MFLPYQKIIWYKKFLLLMMYYCLLHEMVISDVDRNTFIVSRLSNSYRASNGQTKK